MSEIHQMASGAGNPVTSLPILRDHHLVGRLVGGDYLALNSFYGLVSLGMG